MLLIDADAIDRKIVEMTREPAYQHTGEIWLHGLCMAMEAVNKAPTIDAVPVVRCKECKQWTGSKCKRFSFAPFAYCYTNPDDFCSRGERKEGDSND